MADEKNDDEFYSGLVVGMLTTLAVGIVILIIIAKANYTNAGADYYASKILSNYNGIEVRLVRSPWDGDNEVEETITNGKIVSRTKLPHEEFTKEWEAAK
jgi:hypothetical protein